MAKSAPLLASFNAGEWSPLPFPAESHERALDRLTLVAQELSDDATRALSVPKGEAPGITTIPAAPLRAGKLLGFDAAGVPVAMAGTAPSVAVSAYAATLLDDGNAATARATLGAGAAGAAIFQAATAVAANDAVRAIGADIASAATINLDAATGDQVDVTGTTAVTAVTLAAGRLRTVRFTGALTLTHGANLILPGAANIATAAGDVAVFRGYAGGVVRCVAYQRVDGTPVRLPAATAAEVQAGISTSKVQTPLRYTSLNNTLAAGSAGNLTMTHGLGVTPRNIQCWLTCQTSEGGFSVGDELSLNIGDNGSSGTDANVAIIRTSTQVKFFPGGGAGTVFTPVFARPDTNGYFAINLANWRINFIVEP